MGEGWRIKCDFCALAGSGGGGRGKGNDAKSSVAVTKICVPKRTKTRDDVFDQAAAVSLLLAHTNYRTEQKLKYVLINDVLPNAGERFEAKATFLGHVVAKLLRVVTGGEPTPDRDSYEHKRVHVAGVSQAVAPVPRQVPGVHEDGAARVGPAVLLRALAQDGRRRGGRHRPSNLLSLKTLIHWSCRIASNAS